MAEEPRRSSGIGGIGDGIRTGISILSAFREAVEETLEDALKRGDLSQERAKEVVGEAADRIQGSVGGAWDKLDFVPRKEYDALKAEIAELRERVSRLEGGSQSSLPEAPGIIVTE